MKSFKIKWLLTIVLFIQYSCTKIIDINLNDAAPQIVIEGNITNEAGPYKVQITKTINFDETNVFPAVSGAAVTITDITDNVSEVLTETSPGIYETSTLQGLIEHTYELTVLAEGKTYTALSTMPRIVPLDSITFLQFSIFGSTTINPVVHYQEPKDTANYYTFNQYRNGIKVKGTYTSDDRFSDGKYVRQQIFTDSIEVDDVIDIEMNCLDKNAYTYFNTLSQATENDNSISPTNPISNISNNALGYFSAHTIERKSAVAY